MEKVEQKVLTGERALFNSHELDIWYCTFQDGESPLKESDHINLYKSSFKWKYPLWYCNDIYLKDCFLFDTARSGIWYTNNISIQDTIIEAPKTFRRSSKITLENVKMPNAKETFWNCKDIALKNVDAVGDYFGFNSENVAIDGFTISGNYCFDGGKNIVIKNAKLLSKDAFWNCENVIVSDSYIYGEYLGWNSKNIRFINCTIESLQGMCYMNNVVLENCHLINTTLAFEYSSVNAKVNGPIDSVFNPEEGQIECDKILSLTMDEKQIDPSRTIIITKENK